MAVLVPCLPSPLLAADDTPHATTPKTTGKSESSEAVRSKEAAGSQETDSFITVVQAPAEETVQKRCAELEATALKAPRETAPWMELAQYSYMHEEPDQTRTRLRQAITKATDAGLFWRFLAQVSLDDAVSGPAMIQRPGLYKMRKDPPDLSREEFRKLNYEAALDALDHCIACRGDAAQEAMRTRCDILMGLGRWKEAEAQASALLKIQWTPEGAAALAHALLQQGRSDEALALVDAAIKKSPAASDLHAVKAKIHATRGEMTKASEEENTFKKLTGAEPEEDPAQEEETTPASDNK